MRVLIIYDHIPYPPSSGAPIRNYNLLKRLACEHEVWVVGFTDRGNNTEGVEHLRQFCAGVKTVIKPSSRPFDRSELALKYLVNGWPIELRHYYSQPMVNIIQELIAQVDFDVVEIANSLMALYLEFLPPVLRKKSIVTCHDVMFGREERLARLEPRLLRKFRTWIFGRMLRSWEPRYLAGFGRCVTVSDIDQRLLLANNPHLSIDVVPNGIDTQEFQPMPETNENDKLLFVGNMSYLPNVDGALYFCNQILPLIKSQIPKIELTIVGVNPAPEVMALKNAHVQIIGAVDDVRPYYAASAVSIVPLRAGGGTRLKILESMSLGRPVVSTSIGCEGLKVQDGEHLMVADTPEEFASKTIQLLREKHIKNHIVSQGRELAEQHYDWDVIAKELLRSYAEVIK